MRTIILDRAAMAIGPEARRRIGHAVRGVHDDLKSISRRDRAAMVSPERRARERLRLDPLLGVDRRGVESR